MVIAKPCEQMAVIMPSINEYIRVFLESMYVPNINDKLLRYKTKISKIYIFQLFSSNGNFHFYEETIMKLVNTCLSSDVTSNDCTYMILYMSMLQTSSVSMSDNVQITNKSLYIDRQRRKTICLRKTQVNLSGWLYLATYFYLTKQYTKTKYLCFKFIGNITPIVYCCGVVRNQKEFTKTIEFSTMKLHEELKYLAAAAIDIFEKSTLYPTEIDLEVKNRTFKEISMPPLPYAYFLLFMSAYHQHDPHDELTLKLSYLESMAHDTFYGFCLKNPCSYIVLNMIGICHERICSLTKAASYYRYAMNIENNIYSDAANDRFLIIKWQSTVRTLIS